MSDSTLLSGDSTSPHVIRCAECHELVPADRVRHREERVKVTATPAPGRWRAGGPPIFHPSPHHGPHTGPGARRTAASTSRPPRNTYEIERIPVCIDCLRRQRMGLYAVCGVAAACVLLAIGLYSHEEVPPSSQQIALATPDNSTPAPPVVATATPTPQAPLAAPAAAAPPAPEEASDTPPIWQPIWRAATNLFAAAQPTPAPTAAPTSDTPPPAAAVAAAPLDAAAATPAPAAKATQPAAATGPNSAPDAASPAAVNDAPSAPPIWAQEHKPTRKFAKATPAARRDEPPANAVALRNDGYTALEQRRYREALSLLQQATMMGDAYAPMYIGQIFERGIGVPRDVGQASYWYGIAINRGNGAALVAFNRMRINPY